MMPASHVVVEQELARRVAMRSKNNDKKKDTDPTATTDDEKVPNLKSIHMGMAESRVSADIQCLFARCRFTLSRFCQSFKLSRACIMFRCSVTHC